MHRITIQAGLPPAAYRDPRILELEIKNLFNVSWQWVGTTDQLQNPGGILTELAGGVCIAVDGSIGDLQVSLVGGTRRQRIIGASAKTCGNFVFVRLSPFGRDLMDALGLCAPVLEHCEAHFFESYDVASQNWECNWKAGVEIALEGYHVPTVHGAYDIVKKTQKGSNFINAVPTARAPMFLGEHSFSRGIMSGQMRAEMSNIMKRLRIEASAIFTDYDHFGLFPNMMMGFSGGGLCFMQIYTPITPLLTRLRYAYILARPLSSQSFPPVMIKNTLLDKWRDYTRIVLGEDQRACEEFQKGVQRARRPGYIGRYAEERVAHFHNHWRLWVGMDAKNKLIKTAQSEIKKREIKRSKIKLRAVVNTQEATAA